MDTRTHAGLIAAADGLLAAIDQVRHSHGATEAIEAPEHSAAVTPVWGIQARLPLDRSRLREAGCSDATSARLLDIVTRGVAALAAHCEHAFQAQAKRLSSLCEPEEQQTLVRWVSAVRNAFAQALHSASAEIGARILDEVRAAQLRHSSPAPSSTSSHPSDDATINPSGQFRPDIVALLQAAYDAHPGPLSKADRRELARATGLTDKQITCWFGNARQRERKRRQRGASAGSSISAATTATRRSSVRMVPYDVEMAPHHQIQHQHQQQQQHWQPVPFEQQQQRSWSYGSSSLSSSVSSFSSASGSSSDLVEYAEPDAAAAAMWPGMSQAPAHLSSSLAPLLVPPPPAPPMVPMDPQLALDPTGWFSMSSPPSSSPQLGAVPPLLAPPPESFALSPSSWSTSAAASPSPSIDAPLAVPELDFELPFGPTVPAATDAWMDDEFYRNLFGSLGLEVEGAKSGAEAGGDLSAGLGGLDALLGELAGSLGGGASAGGGGLTLRMSEVWDGDAGLGQALQL